MSLAQAWISQAKSDLAAADVLVQKREESLYCHCLAKYQQSVEKSVKGLATAVNELGIIRISIGYRHPVERIAHVLLANVWSFPKGLNKEIQYAFGMYYGDISALDHLAPRKPQQNQLHVRNTEYPFETSAGSWTCPSAAGVFTMREIDRFRRASQDTHYRCARLISTIDKLARTIK